MEADLEKISMKSVRRQLELEMSCSLSEYKQEIEEMVIEAIKLKQIEFEPTEGKNAEVEKLKLEEQDRLLALQLSQSTSRPKRSGTIIMSKKKIRKTKVKDNDDGEKAKRSSGFMKPYILSPALSVVCGEAKEVIYP